MSNLYRIIVTVAYSDTFQSPRAYFSGSAEVFCRSIAKGVKLAEKAANDKSKGAWATPIIRSVSVLNARTGKIVLQEW